MEAMGKVRDLVLSWMMLMLARLSAGWRRLAVNGQEGMGLLEYVVGTAVIVVVAVTVLQALGTGVTELINRIITQLGTLG